MIGYFISILLLHICPKFCPIKRILLEIVDLACQK